MPPSAVHACELDRVRMLRDVACGSFSTSLAGFACRIMSASPRKRPKVAATNWGVPRVNDCRISRTLAGNKRCCIMTRVPCLAVVPCFLPCTCLSARQAARQNPFRHSAHGGPLCLLFLVPCSATLYAYIRIFLINLERIAPRPSKCRPKRADGCSGRGYLIGL